jgi:hypothetical protein
VSGLTLPFVGEWGTDGNVFTIVQGVPNLDYTGGSGSGGVAIAAYSFGYARDGTPAQGLTAFSDVGDGIVGSGKNGVHGISASPTDSGVWGENAGGGYGVAGSTNSLSAAGVYAENTAPGTGEVPSGVALFATANGTGVFAKGSPAGYFQGDVQVTGDLILINSPASGDIAEDFDMDEDPANAEPGTVLVISPTGKLRASLDPYDTRVAGVVSGAGEFRPAVVLQRIETRERRSPVALVGKAFCKVDASFGNIVPGDLLTTSSTPGHAMKVRDRSRALGAILGKALASVDSGLGLIPIIISSR